MLFLISKGMEAKRAFKIMETVRKGKGLAPDMEQDMRKARRSRMVYRILQENKVSLPESPRRRLRNDGHAHRLVQGP
jgi:DNA polymerase-3 subunit alpha (Gram-positive type)